MRYLKWLIPATFVLFFFCGNAFSAAVKIGILDMEKFQKQSVVYQKTLADLQGKADAMKAKLDQESAELRKLKEDFDKQKMMLSLDAQGDKKILLEKKKRYVEYLYEDFNFEIKAVNIAATNRMGKELDKIVKQIGEKEGFTMIIEKRTAGLIYYNKAVDITDQVIKMYDSQHR